jgi:hypothetical protein
MTSKISYHFYFSFVCMRKYFHFVHWSIIEWQIRWNLSWLSCTQVQNRLLIPIWAERQSNRDSIPGRGNPLFSSLSVSRPALRPAESHIQWAPSALSLVIKRSGREYYHSHSSSAQVEYTWMSTPPHIFVTRCLINYAKTSAPLASYECLCIMIQPVGERD